MLIFAVLAVVPAGGATAQDAIVDPELDTPAGAQYQIPVDTARQDASPRPKPREAVNGSKLQSENGFGSSSKVPGASAGAPRTDTAPSAEGDAAVEPRTARTTTTETDEERPRTTETNEARPRTTERDKARTTTTDRGEVPGTAERTASSAAPDDGSGGGLLLLVGGIAAAGGIGIAARRRG